jgi:predicted nucleic acid-binding protein
LLDTSVLVAAMVEGHPAHAASVPWLQRIKTRTDTGVVAAHTLAELYAVLTRLPVTPRISPALAVRLIEGNLIDSCEIISLSGTEYVALLEELAGLGIIGGTVYDGLLLHAAEKSGADRVITLNARDFRRINPGLADRIVSPVEG